MFPNKINLNGSLFNVTRHKANSNNGLLIRKIMMQYMNIVNQCFAMNKFLPLTYDEILEYVLANVPEDTCEATLFLKLAVLYAVKMEILVIQRNKLRLDPLMLAAKPKKKTRGKHVFTTFDAK